MSGMVATFTLSDETVRKIVRSYVIDKHGFSESAFECTVEQSEEDKREGLIRVFVAKKEC